MLFNTKYHQFAWSICVIHWVKNFSSLLQTNHFIFKHIVTMFLLSWRHLPVIWYFSQMLKRLP